MPTMKQVDDMIAQLAQKYHFSEDDARGYLGLSVEVKSKPKACKTKLSPVSSGAHPRAPTAYQNFVKAESGRVRNIMLAGSDVQATGPARGQLQKELGSRWKAMSAKEKAVYAN